MITTVHASNEPEIVILNQNENDRIYDLTSLEWQDPTAIPFTKTENLKSQFLLLEKNHAEYSLSRHHSLLKSRVLLDLHSGRLFGYFGVLLVDFFAFCFILLALSGIYLWLLKNRTS